MALSCIISEIKETLVENRDFFIPPCIRRLHYGGPRLNIAISFRMEKLELSGYPMVKKRW